VTCLQRIISFGIGATTGLVLDVILMFIAIVVFDSELSQAIASIAVISSPIFILTGGILAVVLHHKTCVSKKAVNPVKQMAPDPSDPWIN